MIFRVILGILLIVLPVLIGPWVFPVLVLFFVFLVRNPIEILPIGIIINSLYYFGNNLVVDNWILIFVVFVYLVDLFLSSRVMWRKFL